MRLQSLSWALLAATTAGGIDGLMGARTSSGLESALRTAACGFFYGLLAFHLQRVDPGDSHLQAGLVGAICGLRSLGLPQGLPLPSAPVQGSQWPGELAGGMMELIRAWLPLWLPLAATAMLLHGAQRLNARLNALRRP